MAYFDVTTSQTIDAFLASNPSYQNAPWTRDYIFVSEGAVLSQSDFETAMSLYAVDLILGENSTGDAVIKTGVTSITKTGFTLILTKITTPVYVDTLAPRSPNIGVVTETQDTSIDQKGRSIVTLNWTIPTETELVNDKYIATGGLQEITTSFAPVLFESESVYEVVSVGGGGDSFLTQQFTEDQDIMQIYQPTGFVPGQFVEVDDLSGLVWFYQLLSGSSNLQVNSRCNFQAGFPLGSTVKTVNVIQKTRNLDYSVDYLTGDIVLQPGSFTNGNPVIIVYRAVLVDLSHYELYRVPGDSTVNPQTGHTKVTRNAVAATPGNVLLINNLTGAASSYNDTLLSAENGKTWTYYMFAVDDKSPSNRSWSSSVMVETIPSVPQGIEVSVGDKQVYLGWDQVPVTDQNTNGYNIYRCVGETFLPALCVRLNSLLIQKHAPFFSDSQANLENRRPWTEVPSPENGVTYSYKLESEDTDTAWESGTKNEDSESGAAQLTAVKNG